MAENEQHQRKRARQACVHCNARRVKCDVTERHPCSNCIASSVPCETRESRRGKHPRPSKKRRQSDAPSSTSGQQHADDVAASHVLASLHRDGDRPGDDSANGLPISHDGSKVDSGITQHPDPRNDEDNNVFLGEANALRYLSNVSTASAQPGAAPTPDGRLRHTVPHFVKAEALVPQWEIERRRERVEYLRTQGAFWTPPPHIAQELLTAYFHWFHPCFAVVDEVDIWDQHRRGTLSPLLLQSMLFVAILHCEESVLQDLGFDSRHRAKYVFYNRAKDLYDAELERKKIVVIQSLFLLSFWRAGALLEKDTRHWLACAITLAQTKALHRSAGRAETQEAKLRKRLWWSLYTRDRQCAAALGLPNRVRDEDCDFETLELSDFDYAFNPSIPKKQTDEYAYYAMQITELARLLGNVVHSGYLPNRPFSDPHRAQMKEDLVAFRQRLPPPKQQNDFVQQPGFFSNMLHLAYNNLLILLYRHDYIIDGEGARESDGNLVLQTAAESSRIIEDMLAEGTLRHAQIHVITNLFNTLCIHTVHLRRSEGTTKTVAEHRAKFCLLGLQELQQTWEVTNWVLHLFFQYLDRATAARLKMQEDAHLMSSSGQRSKQPTPGLQPQLAADLPRRNGPPVAYPEGHVLPPVTDVLQPVATPWSWTSDEANHFLFSQIEDQFAFGEGEMLDWSPEETAALNDVIFPPDMDPNFIPQ